MCLSDGKLHIGKLFFLSEEVSFPKFLTVIVTLFFFMIGFEVSVTKWSLFIARLVFLMIIEVSLANKSVVCLYCATIFFLQWQQEVSCTNNSFAFISYATFQSQPLAVSYSSTQVPSSLKRVNPLRSVMKAFPVQTKDT